MSTQTEGLSRQPEMILTPNAIELDWFDGEDVVRVTPRNQQRFEIQKDRAIEILQQAHQRDQFTKQFQLLLDRLSVWGWDRATKIRQAIVTLQDNVLLLVVVRKETRYDEEFEDDLARLDYDIANDPDLQLIKLTTLALPCVSGDPLRSFIDDQLVVVLPIDSPHDGRRSRPHKVS